MARIIVYTGKGGVGKTSVAAATALLAADRGLRTIVLSTDAAHSLADSFDTRLGPEPTPLGPNLWGQELEVFHNIEKYWGTIQSYVSSVFQWRGLDAIMAEEMSVLPGMDELASLLWIAEHNDHGSYDLIVVDAAPTGETLRLLSLPEAGKWWLEKIYPIQRRIAQLASPLVGRVTGMPMPGAEIYTAGEELFHRLEHMHELLSNAELTSIRVVLNLEKMVIKEAQRSFTYFHLYGYPTDLVVCNRVLPQDAGPYFGAWRDAQQRYWPLVEESFAPVPVRAAPFFQEEVLGERMLRALGSAVFGEDDPAAFFYRGRPYTVRREDGRYILELELPFTSREDVRLTRFGDELVLQVGSWRRNLILPRVLTELPTAGAGLIDSTLRVEFAASPHQSTGPASAGRSRQTSGASQHGHE
ncbi:MAG TPA: TRC40/GET3/ArsA family transport-energizing ATPase [Candidatus Limnocylindrales bacterium]